MPSRTVAVLIALVLLVLSVGAGSALMLSKAAPGGNSGELAVRPKATPTVARARARTATPVRRAAVATRPRPSRTFTPAGGTRAQPAPTGVPPAPLTYTPSRTRTPTSTPKPERTGGPVTVPNAHGGRRWVTLQAGHWHSENLPDEMEHLIDHTGASAGGVQEVDINVAVARLAAERLAEMGYNVEILAAPVPMSYTTDLFLALHADGSPYSSIRGFKAVAPWMSVPASDVFVGLLYEEYGRATGLPTDAMTSDNMSNYYAFNPVRYMHAVAPGVPVALLEMGFVTNPIDRRVMGTEQDKLAWGIANAVDRYFHSGAAGPTPSPYPSFTPSNTPTPTRTATPTSTFSPTRTVTVTPTPSPTVAGATATPTDPARRRIAATRTPRPPAPTRTPLPTATPLLPIITSDGRWLPPRSPNGRSLPLPGTDAPPVLLGSADDDPRGKWVPRVPGFVPHTWLQYYMPKLGRSVWVEGPAVPTVTPTRTVTPTVTVTPTATGTSTPLVEVAPTVTPTGPPGG